MDIKLLVQGILDREGGYVEHLADRGGPTCWGITQAVARANGYTGDMRAMPISFARDVYLKRYWLEPGFDRIAIHSAEIAEELADTGVNMGPAVAAKFLQRALNALNSGGKLYADLTADGKIGPASMAALSAYLKHRGDEGETVLLKALNCLQGAGYIEIAETNHSQETFLYGWLNHRVGLP